MFRSSSKDIYLSPRNVTHTHAYTQILHFAFKGMQRLIHEEKTKWAQGQKFRDLEPHQTKHPGSRMTKYYFIQN